MCAPAARCKAEASLKRKPPPLLVMGEVSAELTEGADASSIQRLDVWQERIVVRKAPPFIKELSRRSAA